MKRLMLPLAATVAAISILTASAAIPETGAVNKGAAYLGGQLRLDGSYADSIGTSEDAILAVRAAGFDPARDQAPGGKTPAEYLQANAKNKPAPASAGKAALAARALGLDPKNVGGADLIALINAGYDGAKGTYASDDFSQSIAMLGLACTGNTVPAAALSALKGTQLSDGGWGFAGNSDPDTTAIAMQALLAGGVARDDPAVTKAITWIKTNQLPDGGWGFAPESNTSSTAYVVQALFAAGQSIDIPQYILPGASPRTYLLGQQNGDGSFTGFDPVIATAQVIPALAGRTYCNSADTPITQVRPQPTATPSATTTPTATAVPSTTATKTAAPLPPATGSGTTTGGDVHGLAVLGIAGGLLTASGVALALSRRRR